MIGDQDFHSKELCAISAEYRSLLVEADHLADDHSPSAIFWRAWRASMADAPRARAWKARAIGLNPEPIHNALALAGMAPMHWEERWHLAVAIPQPTPGRFQEEIDDIVLIDRKTARAFVMHDRAATHIAPRSGERVAVLTDAKAWARAIALDRLEWHGTLKARRANLQVEPTWIGDPPSALLLAPPAKVRWSDMRADVLEVPAELRADVRNAMFAQARLPRIEGRT